MPGGLPGGDDFTWIDWYIITSATLAWSPESLKEKFNAGPVSLAGPVNMIMASW